MILKKLRFKHVKGFLENPNSSDGFFELNFHDKFNILIGKNGSGKSSVLEVLAFLGYGYFEERNRKYYKESIIPPYTSNTLVEIQIEDNNSLIELNYRSEKYRTFYSSDNNNPIDTYRLKLNNIRLNGQDIDYSFSIGDFIDLLPESIIKNEILMGYIKNYLTSLIHIHYGFNFFRSPLYLNAFVEDKGRDIFRVCVNYDKYPGKITLEYDFHENKRLTYEILNAYFNISINYSSLPQSDNLGHRTTISNKNKQYSIDNEASGNAWLLYLLLGIVYQENNFILLDEPETFLHPDFQKRLIKLLNERNIQVLLTTHSSVFLDQTLSTQAKVFHFDNHSILEKSYLYNVLDDLGVRPSQILQTNGVVWVEGITDKLYIKKWIQLYCLEKEIDEPVEGLHYSFLEYGGRCLSHLSFEDLTIEQLKTEDIKLLIPVLKNNRNNFIVLDSDKKNYNDAINETKQRVIKECPNTWITVGKEIENYLSQDILDFQLDRFSVISEKYKEFHDKQLDKKEFALSMLDKIESFNWKTLDLEENIKNLVDTINVWNK